MNTRLWLLAAAALWATPALADHHEEKAADTAKAATDMAKGAAAKGADMGASAKRVMDAVKLPATATKLRKGGMSNDEVSGALDAAMGAGLTAGDTASLLSAADAGADGDAWQGNFGTFVKTQLDAGKRGPDLAAAIGAEKDNRKAAKEAAKADGSWQAKGEEMKAAAGEKAGEMAGKAGEMAGKAGDAGKKAGEAMGKSAERAGAAAKDAGAAAKDAGAAAGASAQRAGAAAAKEADKVVDKAAEGAGASAGRARAAAGKAAETTEEAAKDAAKKTPSASRARATGEKKDN